MDATFIIPTYGRLDLLAVCLPTVLGQQYAGAFDVIVVDDGSPEDVAGFLTTRFPTVRCVRHSVNRGFVAAVNTGLKAAAGRLVALVNNDTALAPDWLAHASGPLADDSVASVATRIVYMDDPDRVDSAGDEYSVVGGALKTGHGGRVADRSPERREVFSPCAAAALYRRSCLEEIGGWDEGLGAYYDDVDVGMRLRLAGYRCVYVHEAVCRHMVSASYNPTSFRYHFNSARNAELIWWSSLPVSLLVRYLPDHVAFLGCQSFNKVLQGHFLPYAAGKIAAWARPWRIRKMRRRRQALRRVSAGDLRAAMQQAWFSGYLRWRRTVRGDLGA